MKLKKMFAQATVVATLAVPAVALGPSSPASACGSGGTHWSTFTNVVDGGTCSGRIGTAAKLWGEHTGFYWSGWYYSNANSYTRNFYQTTHAQANCGNC